MCVCVHNSKRWFCIFPTSYKQRQKLALSKLILFLQCGFQAEGRAWVQKCFFFVDKIWRTQMNMCCLGLCSEKTFLNLSFYVHFDSFGYTGQIWSLFSGDFFCSHQTEDNNVLQRLVWPQFCLSATWQTFVIEDFCFHIYSLPSTTESSRRYCWTQSLINESQTRFWGVSNCVR